MEKETISRLQQEGILSELDIQFARFITGLSGKDAEELFVAAALASHYRGGAHLPRSLHP
jgi:hypothetical protein